LAPIIRSSEAADAAVVAAIYVESWNAGFSGLMPSRPLTDELVARWEQTLAAGPPRRWFVAELEGSVVGFAGICPSRDPIEASLGELDTIAVMPAHWRGGIGRALMSVAVAHLTADGYREAILWTLGDYPRGQGFYAAMGWRLDGGARNGGRQVRYRLRLTSLPQPVSAARW
jgi:GNAT superfamily N-acetyltransferase